MNYKILTFIIITFFFLINIVYSLELGISPGNIYFKGNVNEKICKNFSIQSSYDGNIIGETRWINKPEKNKNIKDYNIKPEDLKLVIEIPDKIKSKGISIKEEICINATKPGTYYGALIYKTEEGYAGVGSWITIEIPGKVKVTQEGLDFMSITGLFVGTKDKTTGFKSILLSISLSILFMLVVMLFVLNHIRKSMKNN